MPARKIHPLLEAFPLTVMALAVVLVLFAFAMAALAGGTGRDLHASTSAHLAGEAPSAGEQPRSHQS